MSDCLFQNQALHWFRNCTQLLTFESRRHLELCASLLALDSPWYALNSRVYHSDYICYMHYYISVSVVVSVLASMLNICADES